METLLIVLLPILGWFLFGCGVLAAIDDKEQRLFKWASECPIPFGYELIIAAWPIILWMWYRGK